MGSQIEERVRAVVAALGALSIGVAELVGAVEEERGRRTAAEVEAAEALGEPQEEAQEWAEGAGVEAANVRGFIHQRQERALAQARRDVRRAVERLRELERGVGR